MIVAEVVDDSCEDLEPVSVVSLWLLVLDVALAVLPLALTDAKMPALALALVPLVVVTVSATLMPALLEVLWKAAALVWLVVFSTLASKGLTAPVLLAGRGSILFGWCHFRTVVEGLHCCWVRKRPMSIAFTSFLWGTQRTTMTLLALKMRQVPPGGSGSDRNLISAGTR